MSSTQSAADAARRLVLEAALAARTCHIGSSLSLIDLLTVAYLDVLHDPAGRVDGSAGDRLLLSKGHAASGLYAVLCQAGILDPDEFVAGYCRDGGTLAGHPERGYPGVEITGGSLGHGPSIAIGLALADRHDGDPRRTVCVVGDGELNEGSVWEAVMLAAHLRLANLTMVVDANGLQGLGSVSDVIDMEPLAERFAYRGWSVREIPGHDHGAIRAALEHGTGGPVVVIARTVKAYGVDFLEGDVMSHYRSFGETERDRLMAALEQERRAA